MLSIFFVAIALSMDAFSVALSLGTMNISKYKTFSFSLIVGIMHFFMSLFGFLLGKEILSIFNFNPKVILAIIFFYLATVMLFDKEKKMPNLTNLFGIFILAFSVSIDSFTVGIGLKGLTENYFLSFLLFSVFSFSFTSIGLIIGKYTVSLLKDKATYIGIIILYLLSIVNFCQVLA